MKIPDAGANAQRRQPAATAPRDTEATLAGNAFDRPAIHGAALQMYVDQSPRLLMQRRAMQAAFGHDPVQLASGGGQQAVLLRVDKVAAKQGGALVPSDGSREINLINHAITTMASLTAALSKAPPTANDAWTEFQAQLPMLQKLDKTLKSALNAGDEKLTGDFIDAEADAYEKSIVPSQNKLFGKQALHQDGLYKSLRNSFDSLHVTAQLINNLRSIRYASTKNPETTVAIEVGGYLATAQKAQDAKQYVKNLPSGSDDIYLWNVARFAQGGALMDVMQDAASKLKVQTATFYFHAQPWVVDVYKSSVKATVA
jgi:hypothetical protein